MIARLLGSVLRAVAKLTPGEAGADLDHVGDELMRLDRRPPQTAATSR